MGTSAEEAREIAARYGFHPSWLAGETPRRRLELPGFAIDLYPVTNESFAAFCDATGHPPPPHWPDARPPAPLPDHPVVGVSRHDALAFTEWVGARLPTEAEWEKAARGPAGARYPWGDEFDPARCRWDAHGTAWLATYPHGASPYGVQGLAGATWAGAFAPAPYTEDEPGTAPVTAHPGGESPYGVHDLVGNVAEWCADGPSPAVAWTKGGSWLTAHPLHLRAAERGLSGFAANRLAYVGFRCAWDLDG